MILSNIKKRILIRKIQRVIPERSFSGNSEIAGLVIDDCNLEENLKLLDFCQSPGFKKENFKIAFLGDKEDLPEGVEAIVLNPKEIGFNGKFKAEEVQRFLSADFDFLLCSFTESSWPAALLVSSSKARLKIGAGQDAFGIFDVVINTEDAEIFRRESLKYLKILK